MERIQVGRQVLRHQNLHTILVDLTIPIEFLTSDVGTDRYLCEMTRSIGEAKQVDGSTAPFPLDVDHSVIAHRYLHIPLAYCSILRKHSRVRKDPGNRPSEEFNQQV